MKNLVRNKYEFRDTKCTEVKDFEMGTLTVTRMDTTEIITQRILRDDEKQRNLDL